MAIEMHVLFRGKLPDKRALSRAMADLGFPFTIAAGSLERQSGFMPMQLRREETGVEFSVYNDRADVEELAGQDIDPAFERSANFRWSSDEDEMLAGLCAAAALAKLVNGVVLEETEDRLLSPDEAIAIARETLKAALKPEGTSRRGTRPADIKHYLEPLLKQRGDLVLVGRMLLIRPVRHILRGAFLDRTGDKYSFRIWPYLNPLWTSSQSLGHLRYIHDHLWHVWQPHFEPLLIDVLQEDVFAPLGRITNHDDVFTALSNAGHDIRLTALALAGERERAEEYIRDVANDHDPSSRYWQDWAKAQHAFLARDINEVCAQLHAAEAKTVKALKLDSVWEPSPFPVEVPAAERKNRTAEPLFVTDPWPSRPPGLLLDVPQQAGEVVFAKDSLFREGRNHALVAALTRDEAEERHLNGEDYVLAARLAGGLLLLLWQDGRDRREPGRAEHPNPNPAAYRGGFSIVLYGVQFSTRPSSYRNLDVDDMVEVTLISVDERATGRNVWGCVLERDQSTLEIWDHREGKSNRKKKMTDAEMDRFRCPRPGFGEFDAIVRIVLSVLRSEGYGEIT